MDADLASLVAPARLALTLTCLVFAFATVRALRGRDADERARHAPAVPPLVGWLALLGLPALVLSVPALVLVARALLPIGVGVGLLAASLGLLHAPTRRAFDALDDGQLRTLLGYRAIFGAFLFAGAGLELFPPIFAWTAGLGDLLVAWLAHSAPGSLARGGSRGWRLLVHGWGLLDLVEVVVVAMTVVRPWLAEHGSLGPPTVLPWIGVPLMLALNLHGLRRAIADGAADRGDDVVEAAASGAVSSDAARA